jgi:hypothetical protein
LLNITFVVRSDMLLQRLIDKLTSSPIWIRLHLQ